MTRPLLPLTLLLILPFLAGCVSWYYSPAVYQIRSDLPPGTSLRQVDSYLTEHEIEHSYFRTTNQVVAMVRNIRRDALDIEDKPAYTHP
jgi:hypothetical protein